MGRAKEKETTAPGELDDIEVVRRCREGDDEAWELLIARYKQRVFYLSYQFVGDFAEAEDLVQEVFLKLYGTLDRFDDRQSFKAWMTAVTRNFLIDHYRRHHKQKRLLQGGDEALRTIADKSPSPVRRVERRERAELLRKGLDALPDTLRQAVVLRDVQGLAYDEIARELRIPVGTVKSRINRGRCELAAALRSELKELFPHRSSARR